MKQVSVLLLLLGFCLPVLPARAEVISIDTAITAFEKQIMRDEGIVSRPANITATKLARQQIRDGLRELEFVITHFERHFAAIDPQMIKDMNRIFKAEEAEAANERFSHRHLDSTRNMVAANLPVKKAILKRARDMVYGR
ncbi:MAG: hypothetical protein HZA03_10790 [Nitrospinae bacterium]|nr:hypothetical protein [Nitrospinota bacterium]